MGDYYPPNQTNPPKVITGTPQAFKPEYLPDVIECKSADEANRVNKDLYRFEKYSETRDVYIYIKRRGK